MGKPSSRLSPLTQQALENFITRYGAEVLILEIERITHRRRLAGKYSRYVSRKVKVRPEAA